MGATAGTSGRVTRTVPQPVQRVQGHEARAVMSLHEGTSDEYLAEARDVGTRSYERMVNADRGLASTAGTRARVSPSLYEWTTQADK